MIDEQIRSLTRKPPSVEDAAADIRRLNATLKARREAAPDNALELAALAADLQRASATWRRLVPDAVWSAARADAPEPAFPPTPRRAAHT